MRRLLLLLGICLTVFGAAVAARLAFAPDIVATAYAQEPQSVWQLETAFILDAIRNVSLAAAAVVLLLIVGTLAWPILLRWKGDRPAE